MEFSILMPVYQAQELMSESVDSVLAQSFGDFELLLANDGSTDRSPAICDEYAMQNPGKVRVLHLEHRGLIGARRSAIKAAEGEFIIWLDADDLLEPGTLEALHKMRETAGDPDMIIYEFTAFYDDGRPDDRRPPLFPDQTLFEGEAAKKELYELMIRGSALNSIWTKAVRRELFQSDPTDYEPYMANPFGEDAIQSLYPLTKAGRILYTSSSFCRYRIRHTSIMHDFDKASLDKRYNLGKIEFFKPFMKEWGLLDEEHLKLLQASTYRGVLDGILYFMREENYDQKAVRDYAVDFARKHPDIKTYSRMKSLPARERMLFFLFGNGQFSVMRSVDKLRKLVKH